MFGIAKYVLQKFCHFVKPQKSDTDYKVSNKIHKNLKNPLLHLSNLSNDEKDENNDLPNSKYKDQEYFSTLSNII